MRAAPGGRTVTGMIARVSILAALLTSLLMAAAVPVGASLGEVTQGQKIARQLQSRSASCATLSASDFEHLGEYAMERALGSRVAHQAMNTRMESMLGKETTDRMHDAMGRRFADCPASGSVGGGMMGTGGMMGSGDWVWMHGGNWRHMSTSQWRDAAGSMMGGGWMMSAHNGGWSTPAVVGVIVLASIAAGLIAFVVTRRPRGRQAAPPAPKPL